MKRITLSLLSAVMAVSLSGTVASTAKAETKFDQLRRDHLDNKEESKFDQLRRDHLDNKEESKFDRLRRDHLDNKQS
ncbi:hypothetical protein [Almyronema epifaneia]|uniref:Uncharacterized protein n=1 Tax=Almyronema epifaneia S1 TaxID=2991925 RepID=A0ABW6IGJ9_9CYAN